MTVSTEYTSPVTFAGGTAVLDFTFPHKVLNDDDLIVKVITGTSEVLLTLGVGYTVTGYGPSSNSAVVILTSAVAGGSTLSIERHTNSTQENDFINSNRFDAEAFESSLDKLTMVDQDNRVRVLAAEADIGSLKAKDVDLQDDIDGAIAVNVEQNFTLQNHQTLLTQHGFDIGQLAAHLTGPIPAELISLLPVTKTGALVSQEVRAYVDGWLEIEDFMTAPRVSGGDWTAAFQDAVNQAVSSGRPIRLRGRDYPITSTITCPAGTASLTIVGVRNKTRLIHNVIGAPCLSFGDTLFLRLDDFIIEGNNLTGAAGSGHGIALKDPAFNAGSFLPQQTSINRIFIKKCRGNDTRYNGAAIEACGIYASNALGCRFSDVHAQNCGWGGYFYKCFTPALVNCTFEKADKAELVDDQNECATYIGVEILGLETRATGTIALHDVTLEGGGFMSYASRGTTFMGGKSKNCTNANMTIYSWGGIVVTGNWIRPEGLYGIYNYAAAQIIGNTFDPSVAVTSTRKFIYCNHSASLMGNFGSIAHNIMSFAGGGQIAAFIELVGPAAAPHKLAGSIIGNTFGEPFNLATATVLTDLLKITGRTGEILVSGNSVMAPSNATITTVWNIAGISHDEAGMEFSANRVIAGAGGAITAEWSAVPFPYKVSVRDKNGFSLGRRPSSATVRDITYAKTTLGASVAIPSGGAATFLATINFSGGVDLSKSSLSLGMSFLNSSIILECQPFGSQSVQVTAKNTSGASINIPAGTDVRAVAFQVES